METDGRDTNRAGSSGVDNVVPFPRDWIGPLDDLVPFGASTEDGPEEEEIADAFAADAFWSEGSASLHQVIEAPVVPAEVGRLERGPRATRSVLRRPRLVHGGRFRITALGAAAALMVAAVAVVVELGSPSPGLGHHAALADGGQLRGTGDIGSSAFNESSRLSRLLVARAVERTSRSSGGPRRSMAHRHVGGHKASGGSSGASHVTVSYDVSQPSTTAPAVASTTAPSQRAGTAGQSTVSSSSDRSSSSSSSGPVGPGAPFGPGQMTGG